MPSSPPFEYVCLSSQIGKSIAHARPLRLPDAMPLGGSRGEDAHCSVLLSRQVVQDDKQQVKTGEQGVWEINVLGDADGVVV